MAGILLTPRVRAENLEITGDLAEMSESPADRLIADIARKIQIEHILPWGSRNGPGFDFMEIDVPQSENAEAFEESAGDIPGGKHDRGFRILPWFRKLAGKN